MYLFNQNKMSRIKEEFINDLLSRADIVEIFNRDHKLQKKGANWFCKSPFKEEKTPSCVISPTKQKFFDKSAGINGNVISYLMQKYNFTYPEAVEDLAKFYALDVQYEDSQTSKEQEEKKKKVIELRPILKAVQKHFVEQLHLLPKDHAAWKEIQKRGYTEEQIAHWGIGFAPGNKFVYDLLSRNGMVQPGKDLNLINEKNNDKLWERLTYPIFNERDEILGFASRALRANDKTKWMNPANTEMYDKSFQWYGLNNALNSIAKTGTAWIVEGYNDVIAWQENGIPNTISPFGTAIAEGQINKIKRFAHKIILCLDGDQPGIDATLRNLPKLFAKGFNVEVCHLPDNMDPDDFSRNHFLASEIGIEKFLRDNNLIVNGFAFLMKHWISGETPYEKAEGVKKCSRVLATIEDRTFREIYQEMLQKESKLSKTVLKEIIKDLDAEKNVRKNLDLSSYDLPNRLQGVDISKYEPMIREYGFFQHNGEIWMLVERDDELDTFKSVSNFEIEIIQHMNDDKFPKKLFRIKNKRGIERIFDAPADAMQNTGIFTKTIENQGNYRFKGRTNHLDSLKDYLFDSMGTGRAVDVLCWNPEGFWVWNNEVTIPGEGIVKMDENGVFHHNGITYYVPSANSIYANNPTRYNSQKRVIVRRPSVSLTDYLAQLHKVHRGHGITGILFMLASAFQDHIAAEIKGFPLLFLYGPASSGKDQLSLGLRSFFGKPQSVIALGSKSSTKKALLREFAQFANVITHLSEFRQGDKETDEMLKGIWDRNGYKFGTIESRVSSDEVPILSSALVTGNDFPTDEPLITRLLWEEMTMTDFDAQAKANYNELDDMLKDGISGFTVEILLKRKLVEDRFTREYRSAQSELALRPAFKALPSRIVTNHAILAAMFEIFYNEIKFPFTRDDMMKHFDEMVTNQRRRLENESFIHKFWQIFAANLRVTIPGHLKHGLDFKVDGSHIFFNFSFVYRSVQNDWFRTFSQSAPGKNEMLKVLKDDPCYIDSIKSYRLSNDVNTSVISCDLNKLTEEDRNTILYAVDIQERSKISPSPVTPGLFENNNENSANSDTTITEQEDDLPF